MFAVIMNWPILMGLSIGFFMSMEFFYEYKGGTLQLSPFIAIALSTLSYSFTIATIACGMDGSAFLVWISIFSRMALGHIIGGALAAAIWGRDILSFQLLLWRRAILD